MLESIHTDLTNARRAVQRLLAAWGSRPGGASSQADLQEYALLAAISHSLARLDTRPMVPPSRLVRILRPVWRFLDRRRVRRVRKFWAMFGEPGA